jgi:succinoglycan biosynthesis transport protein ExoP
MTRAALPTSAPSPKPAAAPRPKPAAISLDPVRLLRQHVWGIISTFVIGAILGVILNYVFLYTYQVWSGTVFLEIRNQLKDAKALNAEDLGTEEAVIRLAQTEVARMMSRDNIKMALANDDVQKTEWSNSPSFRDEKNIFNIDEAATELETDLRGSHKRGTQIFTLGWKTHNPEDVPVVLNAVASTYVAQVRANEDNRFATILRVYEANQKKLDDQIAAKKQEIQKFVKERNMTSLNESSSENSRALEKLRDGIANTTSELSIAESRKAQAEEKQSGAAGFSDEDLRDADNDPVMQNLNRDFEDASRRYEASTKQFGEKHTEVLQLKAAQAAVDKQRTDTRKKILLRNQLADLRAAANRVQSLISLLKKQQEDFAKNSVASEDFTMNMAELGTLREQLSQAEDQRKLVSQTINDVNLARLRDESHRVEIVQKAIKPREITFPQLKFMVPGTAVLLCGIYILILFVREILDQRIKYPSDLMGLPGKILGVIPDISDDPTKPKRAELIVFESPHSMTAESFRQSDSLITKGLAPTNAKIILVMSPMPGSGTTTMVLNLAACDASVGRRTLLVGANLRRPRLGKALGLDPNLPGLGDILNGANPSSILIDQGNGLHFIGAGAPSNRTFQLLNTEKMDAFLDWCHQNYDRVYLDAPPSIVAGEGLALANKADASILVVRAWQDQKGLVTKLAYQLMDSKSIFLGTILNRPKNTAGGYFKKNAEAIAEYAADTAAFQLSAGQATPSLLSKDGPKPTTT